MIDFIVNESWYGLSYRSDSGMFFCLIISKLIQCLIPKTVAKPWTIKIVVAVTIKSLYFPCFYWENIVLFLKTSSVHRFLFLQCFKFLFDLDSWTGVFAFQIEEELYLVVAWWDSYPNFAAPDKTCKKFSFLCCSHPGYVLQNKYLILFKDCLQGTIFLPSVFSFCNL